MSETLTLPDAPTIRRTADGQISVFDALEVMGAKQPRVMWQRLRELMPEVDTLVSRHQFSGRGQRFTPVALEKDIPQITQLAQKVAPMELLGEELLVKALKKREALFGDLLDAALGWRFNICRQFPVLDYRLDFYIPEIRLAIEHDGPDHAAKHEADACRQKRIAEHLGCAFIRVDARNELDGLREIIQTCFGGAQHD